MKIKIIIENATVCKFCRVTKTRQKAWQAMLVKYGSFWGGGGGGANGEMANLTNEKGKFAIAVFRLFSPFFAIGSF